ncbi:MAG: ABC transporter permease [Cypionkella sp.]|uniref:ABC transporter permease n=1 Tax=Cypionkella sp. TaxID=2811411 RepID=UPI002ABB7964|nr:ABC transporter permease [Cypionkella sp.]MDZ4311471.1 ABC transporter permease [Cypionkella sp.]MDZ4394793.1 ABC transporter permease [Cypionkella sp.]
MTVLAPRSRRSFAKTNGNQLIVVGLLIILTIIGAVVSDRFLTVANFMNILEQSTTLAIVSLGQTLAVLTGGIDLSVGSIISLTGVLLSGITNGDPGMVAIAILVVLGVGIAVGLLNAAAIVWLRVHPLIVTLGMGAALQGITLLYTNGPAGKMPLGFDWLAFGRVWGVPAGALIAIALSLIVAAYLRYAPFGRYIYAIGDDAAGAKLMGLPRVKVMFFVYGFSGFMAALTAIFLVSRFGVGQPYTGQNFTLTSITPVVVGGTLLSGGRGGVIGTLLGVYLVSLMNNVLNFMDISSHYQLIVQGVIVILAVSVYVENKRKL